MGGEDTNIGADLQNEREKKGDLTMMNLVFLTVQMGSLIFH